MIAVLIITQKSTHVNVNELLWVSLSLVRVTPVHFTLSWTILCVSGIGSQFKGLIISFSISEAQEIEACNLQLSSLEQSWEF